MAIDRVRESLKDFGRDKDILEFETSSATVELAAIALDVEPARIAKTISLKSGESALLVVTAGDAKIDNSKFKSEFGFKAKMLSPEEVLEFTGHAIGGVCPFGLKNNIPVFLDLSLKRFTTVFPACGSSNSAIKLTLSEIEEYSKSKKWVDVCKNWIE
ncbi:YbaK/EbsC family protein [Candidatus Clostridium radicumherbarum]|uniref:YbaK/EbsC family protein n=1 Tax=Candidatus Clostridium radicumherbarum TaxID=3381662 RepID=A0ABW8TNK9_9CLOT